MCLQLSSPWSDELWPNFGLYRLGPIRCAFLRHVTKNDPFLDRFPPKSSVSKFGSIGPNGGIVRIVCVEIWSVFLCFSVYDCFCASCVFSVQLLFNFVLWGLSLWRWWRACVGSVRTSVRRQSVDLFRNHGSCSGRWNMCTGMYSRYFLLWNQKFPIWAFYNSELNGVRRTRVLYVNREKHACSKPAWGLKPVNSNPTRPGPNEACKHPTSRATVWIMDIMEKGSIRASILECSCAPVHCRSPALWWCALNHASLNQLTRFSPPCAAVFLLHDRTIANAVPGR